MSFSLKSVWGPGSGGYIQVTGWPTQHTNVAQVCTSFLDASSERLFAFADPNTRIVVLRCVSFEQAVSDSPRTHLLVRLILALGVADLRHEVILPLENEVLNCRFGHDQLAIASGLLFTYPDSEEIRPLGVYDPGW